MRPENAQVNADGVPPLNIYLAENFQDRARGIRMSHRRIYEESEFSGKTLRDLSSANGFGPQKKVNLQFLELSDKGTSLCHK